MRRDLPSLWVAIGFGLALGIRPVSADGRSQGLPASPKHPVVDEYHGVKVTDDYRWLEADTPETRKWMEQQNARARTYLDGLPGVAALRARVTEIRRAASTYYTGIEVRSGTIFAQKHDPKLNQPLLVTLKSLDDPPEKGERVVVDPNQIDPTGHTAMDFFVPSVDASKVAVSLSSGGTESGSVHVYDVATGQETGDIVTRVHGGTAGGSLAWSSDGSAFFYTRYPRGEERPPEDLDFYQQVWSHKLGQSPEKDSYSLGREFPRIAETALKTSDDGRYTYARVANGDGGEYELYLRTPAAKWTRVATYADKVISAQFGRDGSLYLVSRKDAPRGKLLRLPPGVTNLARAEVVVPSGETVIEDVVATQSKLYVVSMVGGPSRLDLYDQEKKLEVPTLPVSSVGKVVALEGDDILFENESYINPPAWMRYSPRDGKSVRTALFRTAPVDFSRFEVVREWAMSKDGTRVPMNIVRPKDMKLDGKRPVLLTAYGGYGISITPSFAARWFPFLEQGGVFVEANIRGGGEFGEDWHLGGNLTHKQKDYDDFYAVARHLVEAGYTTSKKLAILGGSNGGLLMGAVLTQHPEMYASVVSHVGIYDMLRVERDPNGAFNVTEYGTVAEPDQFRALYAYSPYHHVLDKTPYPAVLLTTGANDPRVMPYHSRKMAARLQAATSSKNPVLLRVNFQGGHGVDSSLSDRIDEDVDVFAFIFQQLGMSYKPPRL
jgi:prolyl oligopeptidase